ncbi:unnamed protein product, partial [Rotaria magnacalcarata]
LFSEFDLNLNGFQYFDSSTNADAYYQHSAQVAGELPPPYDSALLSTNIPQTADVQPVIDNYLSSATLETLLEQDPTQQTI